DGGSAFSSGPPSEEFDSSGGGGARSGSGSGDLRPGTLTAGAWDDNRNFERFLSFRQGLIDDGTPGLVPFTEEEHAAAHARFDDGARPARETLDVALVIDTTGSMGDEIAYLQAELADIAT